MTEKSEHAWSLYHSRISFSLNCKMLSPKEVIEAALRQYNKKPDASLLPQVEGFVRQILGWREYIRGMYWQNMPAYREKNYLNTASALIKQSIHEMEIFVEFLNGKKETVKGLAGLGDLYVSSGGGRNAKMGSYIGEGLIFSIAKKTKMEKVTVEGADLAIEIAKKVNEDFDKKKLPLMIGMINAIVEDKKLELDWESFR